MKKILPVIGLMLIVSVWVICEMSAPPRQRLADAAMNFRQAMADAPTLDDLVSGRLSIVDLTWTLDAENPYWPAENYEPFRLQTIATLEKNGVLSKAFYTPEHLGTHLDAPNHFEPNQPSVDEIQVQDLFAPGVMIDMSMACELDADYRLTVADISAWEDKNDRIPDKAVVFLQTGWSRHWRNYPRYKNQDATGKMHFPGFSKEAAQFLVQERKVAASGLIR